MTPSKTPIQLIREASLLHRVVRSYGSMHDSLAELEQTYVRAGEHGKAAEAHWYGTIVLRSYMTEIDDPAVCTEPSDELPAALAEADAIVRKAAS